MAVPGKYVPDATEGILRPEDLPPPLVIERKRVRKRSRCPRCAHRCYQRRPMERTLHELGSRSSDRPRDLHVTYSQHYCCKCKRHFNVDMDDLASPGSHYTRRVVETTMRLVVEDGLPYRTASWHLWRDHRVFVPWATIQNWVEAGGKKGHGAA